MLNFIFTEGLNIYKASKYTKLYLLLWGHCSPFCQRSVLMNVETVSDYKDAERLTTTVLTFL